MHTTFIFLSVLLTDQLLTDVSMANGNEISIPISRFANVWF